MYNEKTELDVLNMNNLDESLLDNYSNADSQEEIDAKLRQAVESLSLRGVYCETQLVDLGNGFFKEKCKDGTSKNVRNYNLIKKYIDGTTQQGKLINADGKIIVGYKQTAPSQPVITVDNTGAIKKISEPIYEDYPKDKGFVQGDGEGNYYYFPELPDFIKSKIAELEKLQRDAAAATAARLEAENKSAAEKAALRKQEEDARRAFELKKAESERQAKEAEAKRVAAEKQAEIKIAEQKRLAAQAEAQNKLRLAETESKAREAEAKAKNKKAMIVGGSVLALVAGFFIWKKFIK